MIRRLWAEAGRLHDAGIAHRSLRAANVTVEGVGQPWLTDFSFSELAATRRQKDLDLAVSRPCWRFWSVRTGR